MKEEKLHKLIQILIDEAELTWASEDISFRTRDPKEQKELDDLIEEYKKTYNHKSMADIDRGEPLQPYWPKYSRPEE